MSLSKIGELYRGKRFNDALSELEADLKETPQCPYLWLLRGNLVQLSSEPNELPLAEAEKSYLMALKLYPDYIEAMESLAHYYHIVVPDKKQAHEFATLVYARIARLREEMAAIIQS